MWLELRGYHWRSGPVWLATGFRHRWKGLRPDPGHGLLLATSSVHGLGLRVPISITGLDPLGRVLATEALRPNGYRRITGASWILELPLIRTLPPPGATLLAYPWS